jgi:hypothetical protein
LIKILKLDIESIVRINNQEWLNASNINTTMIFYSL